mmetsp:Transcript_9624/g.21129  ORF Transcript_9624/g.21129 Transcript_9624/m.21129 type:complete len:202 (-) Transcript_9624:758-1363(-)
MFALVAFFLLGIERIVYGYIFHFTESFKKLCDGPLKAVLDHDEGLYWMVAKHIGVVIKVFQFGVIGYDLLISRSFGLAPAYLLLPGLGLIGAGQVLNAATFNALGAIGVYYGYQLGYKVPMVSCFPYNMGIGDPQYWGVVLCVWGMYLGLCGAGAEGQVLRHFVVPVLETFWYVMSMKVLEHEKNGAAALKAIGIKSRYAD